MSRHALILGASGGIGGALATALRADGADVTTLSRSSDGLDLTDQASVSRAAQRLGAAEFDLIVNATGALMIDGAAPEKTIAALDAEAMAAQFRLNAIGPALALRYFAPMLAGRRAGAKAIFASLSARVGSIGDNRLGGWISYRAAKAAQHQIIRTAAIEIARRHKGAVVVALHPGTVRTPLTADYTDRHPAISPDRSARALLEVMDGLAPAQTGTVWDWKGAQVPF